MMVRIMRLWIQITADRRMFTVLCMAVVCALLLWARLILISNRPRTAIADDPAQGQTEHPMTSGSFHKGSREAIRIVLDRNPAHDPFVIPDDLFPRFAQITEIDREGRKSDVQPTEDPKQAEARLQKQLQSLVDELRLEAVMTTVALAVIDDRRFTLGSEVPAKSSEHVSFKLVEVRQRSVILEFEGRQFELKMISPGS